MTAVHQILPVLAPHDAVGGHTRRVQAALRSQGHESRIFAEIVVGEPPEGVSLLEDFDRAGAGADLLIFQASTGSAAADWLQSRREPYVVNYHNVTPARFFEPWAPEAAENMRRGRNQLRALAPRSVAGLADSEFNASELVELGYRDVTVTPLLLDLDGVAPAPDARTTAFLQGARRGSHWLFVGRLAPNKCQHDVIAAFALYRTLHDPGARLTLVGSPASTTYADALLGLAEDLGVDRAVTMTSGLDDASLSAYYSDADVFVCLSEHEGFCIPIIEALRHGTPVIALAEAAVPDTAGPAAVLLPAKDPHLVASAVHGLLHDAAWRDQLAGYGHEQVARYALAHTTPVFQAAVQAALDRVGGAARG